MTAIKMQSLVQRLKDIADRKGRYALQLLLEPLFNRVRSCALSTAGLVIKTSSSALAKTGASASYYITRGKLVTIASGTDMPALAGTVSNGAYNVYVFTVDEAGTKSSKMGTEGASLATVKWPSIDTREALIGFIIIHPTGTGDFVGGTTALDDGTVAPNAAYVSPVGVWDPTPKI